MRRIWRCPRPRRTPRRAWGPRRADLPEPRTGRSATFVAGGILASRVTGFVRDVVIAAYFGAGPLMDAYAAALRIPNILRNLLGEGTLSASFVPVYSAALGRRDTEEARATARGVLGLVLSVSGLVVAVGVAAAPWLARLIAPGFDDASWALTTRLVRILFPMSGLMIAGAWCLGVLTSHRRFFLPFAAPVVWNLAQVAGLMLGARLGWEPLIVVLGWSTLAGALLQVLVQLPPAGRLVGGLRPHFGRGSDAVRTVARNAVPVAAGQGIFQISSVVDVVLASTLVAAGGAGAIGGMYYAQRIVQLPMALFGVSIAVAALPEMSRGAAVQALQPHVASGLRRILYFVVPASAFLMLHGDLAIELVYRRGAFGADDVSLVQWILAAYAAGLVATSTVKLFAGGHHALQDTRTPMVYAAVAVVLGIGVGAGLMYALASAGYGARSVAGLALGGALGAWVNLALLARSLARRGLSGVWRASARTIARIVLGTAAAVLVAWPVRAVITARLGEGTAGAGLALAAVAAAGGAAYFAIAGVAPLRRAVRQATDRSAGGEA